MDVDITHPLSKLWALTSAAIYSLSLKFPVKPLRDSRGNCLLSLALCYCNAKLYLPVPHSETCCLQWREQSWLRKELQLLLIFSNFQWHFLNNYFSLVKVSKIVHTILNVSHFDWILAQSQQDSRFVYNVLHLDYMLSPLRQRNFLIDHHMDKLLLFKK